jgi:hypothetical protein
MIMPKVGKPKKVPGAGAPLAILLCWLLCFQPFPGAAAGQAGPAPKINIVIVDGEGAINNIRQRTAREPIVQVEDENHRPVAGAVILFTLPSRGASGVFADGSRTFTTLTDAQGRAVARGITPNQVSGQMQIRVDASFQGQTAHTTITQSNQSGKLAKSGPSAKLLIILALAAAAAVGGICAAKCGGGGGGTPTQPPGTVITSGSGTVGAPPH